MSIKSDKWIRRMAEQTGMIEPFEPGQVRHAADGHRIRTATQLARIQTLKIPPAWRDVRIAAVAGAKVQAIGYDVAGRLQYLYHPGHRRRQESAKHDRLVKFADALPAMRRTT